jgi:hypothetical protein
MTEEHILKEIVSAFESANVFALRDQGVRDRLLGGSPDFDLSDLDLDSLAAMEFCIAMEVNTGVSIVPNDLARIHTLGALVRELQVLVE